MTPYILGGVWSVLQADKEERLPAVVLEVFVHFKDQA
jgi:hypothetical protein